MKKVIYLIGVCTLGFWLSSSGGRSRAPLEKESLSPVMINNEVERSVDENERQKTLNNKQTLNTTTEALNRSQWEKYKETGRKIQDRLRIVDFTLQAIPTGYVISERAKEIKQVQQKIYREMRNAPDVFREAFPIILPKQINFIDDLQMVTRFLAGIVLSYGAINQMERAERQILLDYALSEVNRLYNDSYATLTVIRETSYTIQRRRSLFQYYIDRDKELAQDILKNVKSLGV